MVKRTQDFILNEVFDSINKRLDVNSTIDASNIVLEVNLDNANDDVLVFGFNGTTNQPLQLHPTNSDLFVRLRDTEGDTTRMTKEGNLRVIQSGITILREGFLDDLLDTTDKWTETIVGSATKSITNNILKISVTTSATDSIQENSKQFFEGTLQESVSMFAGVKITDTGITNNRRMWGFSSLDGNDSILFLLDGTTLFAETRFNGTNKQVDITSSLPTDGEFHLYEIRNRGAGNAEFRIDNIRITNIDHDVNPLVGNKKLLAHIHNVNTAATSSSADIFFDDIVITDNSRSVQQIIGLQEGTDILRTVAVDSLGRLQVRSVAGIPADVNSFSSSTNQIIVNTVVETEFFLLRNPVSSGKKLIIVGISAGSDEISAGKSNLLRTYKNPTITAEGTALIEAPFTSGAVSVANSFSISTASANGTLLLLINYGINPFLQTGGLRLELAEGEDLLVTVDVVDTGKNQFVTIIWDEVDV